LTLCAVQDASGERLTVQARFLLDGTAGGPELAFLDTELLLPPTSTEDCLLAASTTAAGAGATGWVAGACLLGLGVATVVVAITIFKSRRSRRQQQGNNNGGGGGGGLRDVGRRMFQRGGRSNTGKRDTKDDIW
jgi:hypothetical protein